MANEFANSDISFVAGTLRAGYSLIFKGIEFRNYDHKEIRAKSATAEGYGKSVRAALADLEETERFIRIAKPKRSL